MFLGAKSSTIHRVFTRSGKSLTTSSVFSFFFLYFSFSLSLSLSFSFPFSLYLSFSLSFWVMLPSFPSVGWCCLVSSFYGWSCCFSLSCLVGCSLFSAFFVPSLGGVAFSLSFCVVLLGFFLLWVVLLFFLLLFDGVVFLLLWMGLLLSPFFCRVVLPGLLLPFGW